MTLVVVETHPVQYHAPVYRALQRDYGVPVTAVYGSDFSVVGYRDPEFATNFAWDTDLLSGYASVFLSRVEEGGARTANEVRAPRLFQVVQDLAPRAVMLVGYSPRFYQWSVLAALRTRRPLLFRAETTDHAVARPTFKAGLRDALLKRLYSQCAQLLYIGRRSYQHFKRLGCADDKLTFSPYCVDTTPFEVDEVARHLLRDGTRQDLHIPADRFVVLLSGKLVQRKAPDLVIHAIKRLPPEVRQRVHVLALGAGAEQAAFEQLAAEQPAVSVTCVGFQNQSRLSAFYHAADLLVLPSRSDETWGLVVNEALHHGLPCVVSDAVGCAPDLIEPGTTGDVFPTGSVAGLAEALQRCLRLAGDEDVRHACRSRVNSYSLERSAAGIARAYFAACPP